MLITIPLRRFLLSLTFLLSLFGVMHAEKLFWVGGSGNFNDPAHWSLTSGGLGGVKTPGLTDDLVFDEHSFRSRTLITIVGGAQSHSVTFAERTRPVIFQGTNNEKWIVSGSFKLNPDVRFDFSGGLYFKSDETNEVFFSTPEIKSNIYFEGNGTWNLSPFKTSPTTEVHLVKGNITANEGGLFLGSLIANQGAVNLRLNGTILSIQDRLILGSNVNLQQTGAYVQANINDAARYQMNNSGAGVDNAKIVPLACTFTTTSVTNPSCNGVCDGTVVISLPAVCGAGPPYKAVWSGGSCTLPATAAGLMPPTYTQTLVCGCATNYTIAFYDAANALKGFATATVTAPGPIVTDYTTTSPTCNGDCDGIIDAVIFGGNPPYTVDWGNGQVDAGNAGIDQLAGLCVTGTSDTYTVTVTDASGCTASDNPVITQPDVLAANGSSTNVTCFGLSDGTATVAATGGTTPYTYEWDSNPGLTAASINTLSAPSTHTCVVTDANGCTDTYTVNITQPADITYSTSSSSPLNCADVCDGTATVSGIAGGTGAYSYSWSPAPGSFSSLATSSVASSVCPVNYTCTITDIVGCTKDATFVLTSPALLVAGAAVTNASCNGGNNGALTGAAAGGTVAYTYNWYKTSAPPAAPSFTGTPYTSLTAGTYTLVVVDSKGCNDTTTVVVAQPSTITITLTGTNPTCFGSANGQVSAVVAGGTGAYTYSWLPAGFTGNGTSTYSALPAGTYTLNITDANGCTQTANVTLSNPTDITANVTVTNPSCNAVCDGSAIAAPTGGAFGAPYTYLWACNGATIDNISGQCGATSCNVTITDVGGCTKTATATFTAPAAITYVQTQTNLTCFDVCNGVATVSTIAGGTTPYAFAWTTAGSVGAPTNTLTSSSVSSICSSTYTCTITDAHGCTAAPNFTITSPALLVASIATTNPLCNTGATGQLLGSSVGGTGAITYNWYNSAQPVAGAAASTSNPYTSLNSGNYTLVAVDASGCNDTISATLTKPSAITITLTGTNPTCFGSTNGQISAVVAGGTGAYTYDWSANGFTGDGTATYSALPAGTYTLDITDANGCTKSANATITNPSDITPNLTVVNPTCNGACNGTAVVAPTGGGGGLSYTYLWACNGATTSNIGGQCAGTCDVTITDNIGCTKTTTATFTAPNLLTVSIANTAITCPGGSNSNLTTTVTGGTATYTYQWSGSSVATTANLTNMGAGSYTVVVTDSKGCTATANVTITAPAVITITPTATNPLCNASCTGTITTVVAGGTAGYTYSWAPTGQTTANIAGLCASITYTLTVTDANGCTQTSNSTLTYPPALTAVASATPVSCSGGNNGTASVVAGGGTPGYTYSWLALGGAGAATASYTILTAAIYTVTVTDANGCTKTATATVSQPTALTITVGSIVSACNICNGSAVLSSSGGTGAVTFSVDGGAFSATTNLTNLCAGLHTVDALDANGCLSSSTFTVPQLITLDITTANTVLTCNASCDGSATANVTGNTGAITYDWEPTTQSTQTATALCAGTHTITVTDAGTGCFVIDSITFTAPPVFTAPSTGSTVTCFGDCDGSVSVAPAGGVAPYTVTWSNGDAGNSSTNLCPATYTATVSDANGCVISPDPTATVSALTSFAATTVSTTLPSTCLSADGSITITPGGGTAPYTHLWNTAATTATINGLASGIYIDVVTDANGCDTTITVGLSDPTGATTTHTNTNNACFGDCTASATVTVTAGTAPFTITWPGNAPVVGLTITVNALCANVYPAQVDDGNGCTVFETVTVTEPSTVTANQVITDVTCNGGTTGSIVLTPTGGTGPYTYTINGVADDNNMTGLAAGAYTIVITDANLCTYTFNYTVNEPALLTVTASATNITCAGPNTGTASVVVGGGTLPYVYSWSNGGVTTSIINIPVGTYTIDVTDGNGCTGQSTATVGQNAVLAPGFAQTNNLCNTGCTGTASFTPTGGDGSYTYLWNSTGNPTTSSVNSLCPGNYRGIVYDGNGCSDTTDFTITAPAVVSATFTNVNPSCNGFTNGTSTAVPAGGTPGYTYSWAPNVSFTALASNLSAGINYTVTVTDANACVGTANVTLTEPAVLSAAVVATAPSCNGVCDGVLTSTPTGGTAPYTYNWYPATTNSVNALCAGTYTLMVTDSKGCTDSVNPVLSDPAALSLSVSTTPTTCGTCNGTMTITLGGGQSINWLSNPPGGSNPVQTNVCAGIYQVELIQTGCRDTFDVTISNSKGPVVALSSTNASCNGVCDGTATLTSVTGGNPGYTYSWSAPIAGTATTATAICAGNHISTVTDAIGCLTFTPFTITEPTIINDNAAIVNATCVGLTDGSISLSPSGDTGPYTYLWAPGGATTSSVTNLPPGTFTCTVNGATGCSQTFTYTVGANTQILYTLNVVNNPCSGQCVGSATLSGIGGGTLPYTYLWSDPGASSTLSATALCSGTYTVNITDGIGCQRQIDTTIITPNPLLDNPSNTLPTCGLCDGQISLVPSGGTPVYSYLWSTGATTATITNVCAGSYTVDITDVNSCTASFTYNINSASAPTVTTTPTHVLCNGNATGSITTSVVGGTVPYFYSWSPGGETTSGITSQTAGIYTVTVTDLNGCAAVVQDTITEPNALNPNPVITQPACGVANGQIILSPIGGTPGYTYLWPTLGNQTTATVSGLSAGLPTVDITDANGCTNTYTITVSNSSGPTVTPTVVDESCGSSCDGSVTTVVAGGTPGYTYLWAPGGQTTSGITSQCAGNYDLQVTDAANCITAISTTINAGSNITVIPTSTDPTCGQSNGQISLNPSGGTAPYTYSWSTGATTQTITGLAAAVYTVTVSDATPCSATYTITLSNAGAPNIALTPTDASCNGICDGSISSLVAGGTTPYTYSWSGLQTTANITAQCAGTYTLTLTDGIGCIATASSTINQQSAIQDNSTVTAPNCGACNGQIVLAPSGGTAPYTYSWSGVVSSNDTVTGLCAGTYTVVITDAVSCANSFTIAVSNSNGPNVALTSVNSGCYGDCTGAITSVVSSGTAPYTYSWTTLPTQTTANISSLCAGTYFVTVTDAASCVTVASANILENSAITYTGNITQPTCGASNGQIIITPAGGTGPYTFNWAGVVSVNDTVSNLAAGSYTVTITDAIGCDSVIGITLSNAGAPTVSLTPTDINCYNVCTGAITSNVSGGTLPYTYSWSAGLGSSANLSNLCEGTYTLTLTDAIGCIAVTQATIDQPDSLGANPTITQPSCGMSNGQVVLNPFGGIPAYTYSWNVVPANTTNTISAISAGTQTVTITDANTCVSTFTISVSNPGGPTVTATPTNIACYSDCNGAVTTTISGGTPAYTYSWSNGAVTQNISNQCAGTYFITVNDASNCTTVASATISQNDSIQADPTITQPTCGASNGQIALNTQGGVPNYTYSWTGSASVNDTISNLNAGAYSVTISDAAGCSSTFAINLSNAGAPNVATTVTDLSCYNVCIGAIATTVTGGTTPYQYSWAAGGQTTANITNQCAGIYTVTVTDAIGCIAVVSDTIYQPDSLQANPTIIQPACATSNGQIALAPIGGTPAYTYSWLVVPVSTNDTLSNIAAGTYTVQITDAHACASSFTIAVSNPGGPTVTATPTDIDCFDAANGSITTTVTGGTTPYAYQWSPGGQITTSISNQAPGTYFITVSDANHCTSVASATITENDSLQANPTVTKPNCTQSNGSIVLNPSGGVAPYTYVWTNGAGTNTTASNLAAGSYTVTITDSKGCSSVFVIAVSDINAPTVTTTTTNIICHGLCNGAASATVSGGVSPYNYSWNTSPVNLTASISNQCAGTYFVSVTDAVGCTAVVPANILEPDSVLPNANITNPSCGLNNGQIVLNPSGGTPIYHYLWGNADTTATLSNIGAGIDIVQITDAAGCVSTYTITISNPGAPTITTTTTDITCNRLCNGSITTAVTGGTAPYTYIWTPLGQVSANVTDLCPDTYFVQVTDQGGCSAVASATINQPAAITANPTVTNPQCGACNGTVSITPSGGSGSGYTYQWGSGQTTSTLTNVCAGVYNVLITDGTSCTATYSVAVSNSGAATVTLNPNNVTCNGACNGSITSLVNGNAPPYIYSWLPDHQSTTSINGLCAGTYYLQVLDTNGCIATAQTVITEPAKFNVIPVIDPPTCGLCNGQLTVQSLGGNGALTYLWNTGSTNDTISALCAGAYNVIISNLAGCRDTINIPLNSISNNPALTVTPSNVSCFGLCDGSAAVAITGGVAPYSAPAWTLNGASIGTGTPLNLLCDGQYGVTVTDASGCSSTAYAVIHQPSRLVLSFSNIINPLCHGVCLGQIDVLPSGGTLLYSFDWTPAQNPSGSSTDSLCASNYTIKVTDQNGCTVTESTALTEPSAIQINALITNTPCNNLAQGAIDVTVTGGTPIPIVGYHYQWSGNIASINQDISNLVSGTYSLSVSDKNNCVVDTVLHVSSIDTVLAHAGNDTTLCLYGPIVLNGSASTANHGTMSYVWSQLQPTTPIGNTVAVSITPPIDTTLYQLIVTNSNGCKDTDNVQVIAFPIPTASAGPDVEMFLGHNSVIGGSPSGTGGTVPYNYHWTAIDTTFLSGTYDSNPLTSTEVSMTYTLMVMDANGCISLDSMRLIILPPVVVPSGFSPNTDGHNDAWVIDNIWRFPNNELYIYNRWGEPLYYKRNYDNTWSGTYNNKPLPVGTYYYVLKLNDAEFPEPFTGPVTIFR